MSEEKMKVMRKALQDAIDQWAGATLSTDDKLIHGGDCALCKEYNEAYRNEAKCPKCEGCPVAAGQPIRCTSVLEEIVRQVCGNHILSEDIEIGFNHVEIINDDPFTVADVKRISELAVDYLRHLQVQVGRPE